MGALKVWTGSQWTETGGGLRDVPAGVVMAEATRNAAVQSVSATTWTKLTLDTTVKDTDNIFDDANDRFTIPAGMGGPWHFEARSFITAATDMQLAIYKNGADWRRINEERGGSSEFVGPITATDQDASPGDYYEIYAYCPTTEDWGHASVASAYTRFTAYKLGSGTVGEAIGAKAYEESTQSIPTSSNTDVTFDTLIFDSDGFTDLGGASDEFTVPAGLAGKYLAVGGVEFVANASGYRRLMIAINGTSTDTIMHEGTPDGSDVTRIAGSAILDLAVGDVVTLQARQTSGGNLNIGNAGAGRSHFALVLLATSGELGPRSPGYTLDYTEKTSATSVTSTSSASPDTIVSSGAVSYDGSTEVDIEFWVAGATPSASAGANLIFQLWDGGTNIGTFGYVYSQAANNAYTPVSLKRRVTPSAGSHTYHVKAYVSTGTGTLSTGAGGSGNNMPGYIKITRA